MDIVGFDFILNNFVIQVHLQGNDNCVTDNNVNDKGLEDDKVYYVYYDVDDYNTLDNSISIKVQAFKAYHYVLNRFMDV